MQIYGEGGYNQKQIRTLPEMVGSNKTFSYLGVNISLNGNFYRPRGYKT